MSESASPDTAHEAAGDITMSDAPIVVGDASKDAINVATTSSSESIPKLSIDQSDQSKASPLSVTQSKSTIFKERSAEEQVQLESEIEVLETAITNASREACIQAIRKQYRKTLLGDAANESYLIRLILQNSQHQHVLIKHLCQGKWGDVLGAATTPFLDRAMELRLATISAPDLVLMLARTQRLGYDEEDIVEDESHVLPVGTTAVNHVQGMSLNGFRSEPREVVEVKPHNTNGAASSRSPQQAQQGQPAVPSSKHMCQHCGKTFTQSGGLTYHTLNKVCINKPPQPEAGMGKVNSKLKAFCPKCNRGFTAQASMRAHLENKVCENREPATVIAHSEPPASRPNEWAYPQHSQQPMHAPPPGYMVSSQPPPQDQRPPSYSMAPINSTLPAHAPTVPLQRPPLHSPQVSADGLARSSEEQLTYRRGGVVVSMQDHATRGPQPFQPVNRPPLKSQSPIWIVDDQPAGVQQSTHDSREGNNVSEGARRPTQPSLPPNVYQTPYTQAAQTSTPTTFAAGSGIVYAKVPSTQPPNSYGPVPGPLPPSFANVLNTPTSPPMLASTQRGRKNSSGNSSATPSQGKKPASNVTPSSETGRVMPEDLAPEVRAKMEADLAAEAARVQARIDALDHSAPDFEETALKFRLTSATRASNIRKGYGVRLRIRGPNKTTIERQGGSPSVSKAPNGRKPPGRSSLGPASAQTDGHVQMDEHAGKRRRVNTIGDSEAYDVNGRTDQENVPITAPASGEVLDVVGNGHRESSAPTAPMMDSAGNRELVPARADLKQRSPSQPARGPSRAEQQASRPSPPTTSGFAAINTGFAAINVPAKKHSAPITVPRGIDVRGPRKAYEDDSDNDSSDGDIPARAPSPVSRKSPMVVR